MGKLDSTPMELATNPLGSSPNAAAHLYRNLARLELQWKGHPCSIQDQRPILPPGLQLHYSLPLIYHLMDRLHYQSNMSLSALCSIPTTTPLLFVTPQENSQMPYLTCYFLSSPPIFTSFNVSLAFIPVFSQLHTDKKLFLLRLPV